MSKRIMVVEEVLRANQMRAEEVRQRLDAYKIFALNVMASPGAGKTSVITRTVEALQKDLRIGYIDGDVDTTIDADRIEKLGIPAVQINTGGACHLDANMLGLALPHLDLGALELLIIENVGNLICPGEFKLGVHLNVLIASIPEGDDKPYKYPAMYRGVDVLIINKMDLLPYIIFDLDYFKHGAQTLNPGLTTFQISCRTGDGIPEWVSWLQNQVLYFRRR